MKYLSLFTGIGGGDLGLQHLLGWKAMGYVEYEPYCQKVIRQRIKDGYLTQAPIFGDVRAFIDDGFAESYQDLVDVVTGGFPCQPFSTAGKRAGADDPRNMWPQTLRVIQAARPAYAFLENVPGLLTSGYFGTVLQGLAESGYNARWRCLSAAELGASHMRNRLWIVADSESDRIMRTSHQNQGRKSNFSVQKRAIRKGNKKRARDFITISSGFFRRTVIKLAEPDGGYDDGSFFVDRIKALGNAQVPIVAATAWRLLTEDMPV